MRKVKNIIAVMLALFLFLSTLSVSAVTEHKTPYDTYTYSYEDNSELFSTTAYLPKEEIKGENLGLSDFNNISDIYIDEKNNIVVLADSGNNRIIITDTEFKSAKALTGATSNGKETAFTEPKGVFIDESGYLYIADTGNSRILKITLTGELIMEIGTPSIKQLEDVVYMPTKVAVSPQGEIYAVAEGIYEGILTFDTQGEYQGFAGSNKVTPSLWDRFWYKFSSKKQKQSMMAFLPVVFTSLDMGEEEFVYTVSQFDNNISSLVKKLNPGGNDVLRNNSGQSIIGDHGNIWYGRNVGRTNFSDVSYLGNGIIACLDSLRNKVFLYNGDCELLFVFGGRGSQNGNFDTPAAIDNYGTTLFVADSMLNSITVFSPTEYALAILNGISFYESGNYEESRKCFNKAILLNSNSEVAYLALGKMQLREGNVKSALNSFYLANNRTYYSKAFQKYRNELFGEYFYFFFAAVILALAWFIIRIPLKNVIAKRKSIVAMTKEDGYLESIAFASYCMFHPFKGFNDIKREGKGSLKAAISILGLLCIGTVFLSSMKGYIFGGKAMPNLLLECVKILLPVFFFCALNWCVTTLFDGEGKIKEIFISCCYSLWPLVISRIPLLLLSNVLTAEEAGFYYAFETFVYVYTVFLVLVGNLTVQNFSMGKTIKMAFATVLGIAIVIFIIFLFFNLWYEVVAWISQMIKELRFR